MYDNAQGAEKRSAQVLLFGHLKLVHHSFEKHELTNVLIVVFFHALVWQFDLP